MDGGCVWNPDDAGYVSFREVRVNAECPLPPFIAGFAIEEVIVDKHGHELDGDHDPRGAGGCDHRDSPEWKAEHARTPHKEHPVEQTNESTTDTTPVMLAVNETPAAPVATTATVGVDEAIGQVKSLVPEGTSPGLLIGGAALLAVVAAAIKLGPGILKARTETAEREHEREMEKLKLERERQDKQDDQHAKCSVERAALEAQLAQTKETLAALRARIDAVESKASEKSSGSSVDLGDFDPEALEQRLVKIERALKPAKGRKA